MNILDIKIKKLIPYAIDAYVHVFGEEYRSIIEERLNKLSWVYYSNIDGVENYASFLKKCKRKELATEFLEQIGIDVSKQKEKGFAEDFDADLSEILEKYLGEEYSLMFIPEFKDKVFDGIRAWISKDETKKVRQEKIKFLNYIRGQDKTPITEENYDDFCKTEEYKQILQKIESYLQLFDEKVKKYEEFLGTLKDYDDYCASERKRKAEIEKSVKEDLYSDIQAFLPEELRRLLDAENNSSIEKYNYLLGSELGIKSRLEYFSLEDEEKLNNPDTPSLEKQIIIENRINFFKYSLDLDISKLEKQFDTKLDLYNYLMNQPEYKNLIPSNEDISKISNLKQEGYNKASHKFLEELPNYTHCILVDNRVCTGPVINEKGEIFQVLYFTVRNYDQGFIDSIFLHEICHVIESRENKEKCQHSSGFEENLDLNKQCVMSKYLNNKRKYERFNECVTDIFANEATEYLHSKGIYLIEPKEICFHQEKNTNTHIFIRDLIKPFIEKYREAVLKARILGDYTDLFNQIGQENFEELNDVISKIDSMWFKGVLEPDKVSVETNREYTKELERLQQVYRNMENYQAKSLEDHEEAEDRD